MLKLFRNIIIIVVLSFCIQSSFAQINKKTSIEIGAQVFIEPGQTDYEIDLWFKRLSENGMFVCRIRMFEDYMRKADGTWDFSLFDKAFKAAEKYNVKIFATLFPSAPDNSVGGFKFPESQQHENQIAVYIEKTVSHFKNFSSLYGWVLINEPGTGGWVPQTAYTKQKFEEWKKNRKATDYNSKNYNTSLANFDKEQFLVDYNTWYLNWIANEIAKYDNKSHIHVNNHGIFDNIAEYNFPEWRNFLSSLGASAHPSWHFGYFDRSKYTVAMSANCNMIRSGAGNLPFWVTELQGGNNTYSGFMAFCATKEEITQWLWTSIFSGSQGIIFWCLNPRSIGEEAGEWALLDFQNNPSDRFVAASKVVDCLNNNSGIFNNLSELNSNITILYTRSSLWTEKKVQYKNNFDHDYEGRLPGGVIKSAVAYYEILSENGIVPNLGEIGEFDWTKDDYSEETIILANQISIPSDYWDSVRNFVRKGGKLIVEGLTAFYDENMLSLHNTGFPLSDVFGGALKEIKCTPGDFEITLKDAMPCHLLKGYIHNESGKVLFEENGIAIATRNSFGKGEVLWIPSLLGLGARRTGQSEFLSKFLIEELSNSIKKFPVKFSSYEKGVFMQTVKSSDGYLSLIVNKTNEKKDLRITVENKLKPHIVFSDNNGLVKGNTITISPEESMLLLWK